jgi:hypothetical protein
VHAGRAFSTQIKLCPSVPYGHGRALGHATRGGSRAPRVMAVPTRGGK